MSATRRPSVRPSVLPSVWLSFCLQVRSTVRLSTYPSVRLSFQTSLHPFFHRPSVRVRVRHSYINLVFPFVRPSVRLPVRTTAHTPIRRPHAHPSPFRLSLFVIRLSVFYTIPSTDLSSPLRETRPRANIPPFWISRQPLSYRPFARVYPSIC